MEIEYDNSKNQRNIKERGLSFAAVKDLDWPNALIWLDTRKDYGEERWSALVPMADRLCFVSYTWRQDTMRVISLRKANNREVNKYEKEVYP